MTPTRLRVLGAGIAAAALATAVASTPAQAHDRDKGKGYHPSPRTTTVQLLSFNDYHGHLEATDPPLSATLDPSRTPAGGAEYLATALESLRAKAPGGRSLTVAAGDLIGGSPFLSGLFHDEPSVESLNAMDLDVSSVGNHEFDEGTAELLRMQRGGCHPDDGCYFQDAPVRRCRLPVARRQRRGQGQEVLLARHHHPHKERTLLPATSIKKVGGVKIGFIGMTLEGTPTLVDPAGVASVEFKDEVETANKQAT